MADDSDPGSATNTFTQISAYSKSHLESHPGDSLPSLKIRFPHFCQKPKRSYLTSMNLNFFLCRPRVRTVERGVERINTVKVKMAIA